MITLATMTGSILMTALLLAIKLRGAPIDWWFVMLPTWGYGAMTCLGFVGLIVFYLLIDLVDRLEAWLRA